jgi:hypothetical protein
MIDRMMNLLLNKFRIFYLFLFVTIIGCESPTTQSPLYLPQGFEATGFCGQYYRNCSPYGRE